MEILLLSFCVEGVIESNNMVAVIKRNVSISQVIPQI